jgi:hypothetical protein
MVLLRGLGLLKNLVLFVQVYMICSSNVFIINNLDPNPKLRLRPDPKKITGKYHDQNSAFPGSKLH